MNIYSSVRKFIISHNLIEKGDTVLLSLSAGKDSMAMLHILIGLSSEINFRIACFHLNHMMRGKESDLDEEMVKDAASLNNSAVFLKRFDFKNNKKSGLSFEEHARDVRYRMLREIMKNEGFNKIATAHSRDDNIETIIMRLFTGTGIYGLRGIDYINGDIIRPIYNLSSDEIYYYLDENSIAWREDESNSNNEYLRNNIRNKLIPEISRIFSQYSSSISRLSTHARENELLIDTLLKDRFGETYSVKNNSVWINPDIIGAGNISMIKFIVSTAVRECFGLNATFGMLSEIEKNIVSEKSNLLLYISRDIRIEKIYSDNKSYIKISSIQDKSNPTDRWEYEINIEQYEENQIFMKEFDKSVIVKTVDYQYFLNNKSEKNIFVSIKKDINTILIRNRRAGDRIVLDCGTKKIKDLLIEKKLDSVSKNCVPLIVIDSTVAAFIPGLIMNHSNRVSVKFLVNDSSKKILAIYSTD